MNEYLNHWCGEKGVAREFPKDREVPDPRIATLPNYCVLPVCEIGCGSGRIAAYFTEQYTGVDVNDVAIARAKIRFPMHTFIHIQHDGLYPMAESYLFHTVLLHIPDDVLPTMITRCHGKKIIVAESMDRRFRDGKYVYTRDADEYDAIFASVGYTPEHYERLFMDSRPGFWDIKVYSIGDN